MRDIFVTAVVFGALPFVLARPYIGILLWTWVSFMNPQRLCWGFAYDFPFAYIIALVTLVSLLISREPKKIPWTRETIVLLVFVLWMVVTTIVEDPIYLQNPLILSAQFKKQADASGWDPTPCSARW